MMPRSVAWLAVIMIGLGLGAQADAQPRRRNGPDGAERRGMGAAERRERLKKKIRAHRAYVLTEELALDDQAAGRLFPVLARYDDDIDRLLQKRVDHQQRLRRADQVRDPRALERLIDDAVANQRAFWELEDKRLVELRKILTPVQTARLLVVLPDLERKILNQLRRAIVRRDDAKLDEPDDDPQSDELEASPPRREDNLPRSRGSSAPGNTPPCDPLHQRCR